MAISTNVQPSDPAGWQTQPAVLARTRREQQARRLFSAFAVLPVALILAVALGLAARSWPIFAAYPLQDLLFGTVWKPSEFSFGLLPFIAGTFWVTLVGVGLAVPPCMLIAVYLSEYAHAGTRAFVRPALDLLAAIPSVVFGVWGLVVIVPFVQQVLAPLANSTVGGVLPFFASSQPTGFSVLAGGLVVAVMIAPLLVSVVYEVMLTLPNDLRRASLAIGATRWETIRRVLLPQVLPGMLAAVVLGASRALGETIAVLMVVGNIPQIPASVFDAAYPLPALIANNYGEMMSIPLYDSALLGAALILLAVIVFFNVASQVVLLRLKQRKWQ